MRLSTTGVGVLAALVLFLCITWMFRSPSAVVTSSSDTQTLAELRSLREAIASFPEYCRIAAKTASARLPQQQLSRAGDVVRAKGELSHAAVLTQIYEANKERQRAIWASWDGRDFEQWTWFFFEVLFPCDYPERVGQWGDGGKWLCRPRHLIANKPDCLIYSVGSAANFDFEIALLELNPACQIHVFDPTPSSVKETQRQRDQGLIPEQVHYHALALLPKDGTMKMEGQTVQGRSLSSLVRHLGHEGRTLDLLKVDIEGWEWSSLDFSDPFYADSVMQFAVEMHLSPGVLREQGISPPHQTNAMKRFGDSLERAGFELFAKEVNPGVTCCYELAFVNRRFFPITANGNG